MTWENLGEQTTADLIQLGMGYHSSRLNAILGRGMVRGEVDIGNDSMWTVLKGNTYFRYKAPRRFIGNRWFKVYVAPNPSGDPKLPLIIKPYKN